MDSMLFCVRCPRSNLLSLSRMSQKYLKRIDKKMDRLLEIAEQFAGATAVPLVEPPAAATEEPFYFQTSAAAPAAAAAAAAAPTPAFEPVNFELEEEAPAAAAAAAAAPSFVKASKVNNWNKLVSEVLGNMKSSGWKNPNTGKNATRRNAMKEASRRKAEANANYAATAASRRAKRNKQLASKASMASAVAAFNAAGAPAAANVPAATAGNLVNTTAAAALLAGPPRKGNGPPPSMRPKLKLMSVPVVYAPAEVKRLETLLQNASMPADKRQELEKKLDEYKGMLATLNKPA